jgi:threonine dehydratase
MHPVTLDSIVAARHRIADGIVKTPCEESPLLSELCGCRVFSKREYLQRTGSFKERGARNALLRLSPEARTRGVVAASAGNHALALAYHGRDLGIPVTVVMPVFAPLVKQIRARDLGAKVLLSGANIGEAKEQADALADSEGLTYVHGFDAPDVIAGQGTLGLEILEQVPSLDAIIVPIGGAGLIAGVGMAVKAVRPEVQLIGVEPEGAASYRAAVEAGAPCRTEMRPTLGDGLAVPTVGENAFRIAREVIDRTVLVDESAIALAILRLVELEKGVVEGSGAAPLAALMSGQLPELAGKKVVILLCGGNIDPAVLGRVIDHGLVADGRLTRFEVLISDRPGGLAALTASIAATGASVKQIVHERAFTTPDISRVKVNVIVETRDSEHATALRAKLDAEGMQIV